jgi:hypothetical protein
MWYADSQDLPAVAPLYDISTIFYFTDEPTPRPEVAVVGLVVHLALSAGFGVLPATFAPLFGSARAMALGALGYGLLLAPFLTGYVTATERTRVGATAQPQRAA